MGTSSLKLQQGNVGLQDFVPAPIPPENVLDGEPVARTCNLSQSDDQGLSMNLWDCTAGRFRWNYYGDELAHILEGEVHVTEETGEVTVLQAGDTAHFPAGARTVWEVPEYVKKLAVHRTPPNLPARVVHKLKTVRARAALKSAAAAV